MKTTIHRAGLAAALLLSPLMVQAADHLDGPRVSTMPAADINDVFAWMSQDASKVNLIMTVWPNAGPAAKFADNVIYSFNTGSASGYGQASTDKSLECTFNAAQVITCTIDGVTVTGDASSETGIESPNGDMRVFAGLRNDPFFFNLSGFQNATATVNAVATAPEGLTFDSDNCPVITADQSALLVGQLSTAPDGGAAVDAFADFNTLAIVLQVDKSLLTSGGPILSVWANTQLVAK